MVNVRCESMREKRTSFVCCKRCNIHDLSILICFVWPCWMRDWARHPAVSSAQCDHQRDWGQLCRGHVGDLGGGPRHWIRHHPTGIPVCMSWQYENLVKCFGSEVFKRRGAREIWRACRRWKAQGAAKNIWNLDFVCTGDLAWLQTQSTVAVAAALAVAHGIVKILKDSSPQKSLVFLIVIFFSLQLFIDLDCFGVSCTV